MKVSFDGLRKNLANAFTKTVAGWREVQEDLFDPDSYPGVTEGLSEMRQMICGLLACYDEDSIVEDNDMHDLSDLAERLPSVEEK